MKPAAVNRSVLGVALFLGALLPIAALAQMPARFYWHSLSDSNAFPLIVSSTSGDTNPFNPAELVEADANIDGTLALFGYARTFSLWDRSAMVVFLAPMGRVSSDITVAGRSAGQAARGFGDPMVEFDLNIIGPKAQKSLPDVLRFEPGFSLDLLADLAFPIGEYDSKQPLNLGQNRWYGRVGFPIVWQLGPWVPGKRTTLEFLPAVWFYGNNSDFVGQELKTDPKVQVDAHLTRDFTDKFWGSLDAFYSNGGKSTIHGIEGEKIDSLSVGVTFGYQITQNLGLTFGYKSTVNDHDPTDVRQDGFMFTLVFGWNKIIEGMNRLKSE
jgi:hypothetical protein